jgi:sucrose-6-phosphate hydrolase SacC (GH32 family)
MLEIELELESKDDKYGIKIRRSPDDQEYTTIFHDAVNKKLRADLLKSSLRTGGFAGPRDLLSGTDKRADIIGQFDLMGEPLKLHIYIDKGLVQAYANDLKSITTWTYPTLEASKGLQIWSEGGKAKIKSMKVWKMQSIYY